MMESSAFQPNVRKTTMKMASVSVVSVFLLCCFFATSQGCDRYAVTGSSVNVSLGHTLKADDRRMTWKFNENPIFDQRSQTVNIGKKDDINADGSLKLTNVKKGQEGLYKPEVYDKDGKLVPLKSTKLCVRDPVKKPKVQATCKEDKVKIECILGQQPKDAKYEWLQNGKIRKEKKNFLEINAAETKAHTFACNVSNEVDSKTSEAINHNCVKSSIPGLPDELFGISIWVFVGGGGGIVLLLIILVIVCCLSSRRKRMLRLKEQYNHNGTQIIKDEEELRLEWTNTEQHNHHHPLPPLPNNPPPHHHHHQHHNHHHHQQQQQQQQAPGNTGPRQSRSKQNRQPRAKAPEPNGQPQPSPRRTVQAQKPANDADDEQPPPLPQPRKKTPKKQVE